MLPDFDRADRIGEFSSYPESRTFAELLIDSEEDRSLRAVLAYSSSSKVAPSSNMRSLIRVAQGLRKRQERLVDR